MKKVAALSLLFSLSGFYLSSGVDYPKLTLTLAVTVMLLLMYKFKSQDQPPRFFVANPMSPQEFEQQSRRYTQAQLANLMQSPEFKRRVNGPTPSRLFRE